MKDLSQRKAVTILRFLYPIWMIFGLFGVMYVPSALIVAGDAAKTAANLIANEFLFRAGIVSSLLTQLMFIFVVLVLYKLFKPVNKNQSLLMVIFALVAVPIAMLNTLNRVAALMLTDSAEQMMFFLNLNAQGVIIASIFWGLWLFPLGYLIYKSGYFPKTVGVLMIIGGFGYFIGSFVHLLLNHAVLIFEIMAFGEMIFIFWIIIRGAKLPKIDSESSKTDN